MSAQPTQRTYTAASIVASCAAIIASNSPQQQRQTFARVNTAPSPKATGATSKKVEAPEPRMVAVMTVHAQTVEEQMREMMRKLEQVTKDNEEQNKKIEELQREVVALGKQKVGEADPAVQANAVEIPKDEAVESNKTTATECPDTDEVARRVVDETTEKKVRQEWIAKVVVPLTSAPKTQVVNPPLTGVVFSSHQAPDGKATIEGRFSDNTYKLFEKSGYDFKRPAPLERVIESHPYGLDQIRGAIPRNTSLGYECPPPIKISAQRKEDTSSANYIATEEVEEGEEEFDFPPQASSVSDKIRPLARKSGPSVFNRISTSARQQSLLSRKCSPVFNRLRAQDANNDINTPQNKGHQSYRRSKLSEDSFSNHLGASLKAGEQTKSLKNSTITSHITESKFKSKWDDPHTVQEVYTNRAYKIANKIATPQKTNEKKGTKAHTATPHPSKPASKATKNDNLKIPASARKTHAHS